MSEAAPEAARLAAALERGAGASVRVTNLRRLSGGASRETWSFEATDHHGVTRRLVLRRDPGSHPGQSERSTEYLLVAAAARAGVPVPPVVLLLDAGDELGSGFVMEHVEGETIPRRILRDDAYARARPRLAAQCGEIAARIHSVEVGSLPELPALDGPTQSGQFRDLMDAFGEPHPAFELGFEWLAANISPGPRQPRLVHGDFRNGNFIVGPDGIRSVLDWELAHLGDPVEDLAWLCVKSWRFGVPERIVGGFGDVDDLLDAYERAGGARPDLDALRYWIVLGTLKWGVMCIAQAFTHLGGVVHSVELATIGRRVAEMEWDLLALLDGGL